MNTKKELEKHLDGLTKELDKFLARTENWNERKLNFRLSHHDWNALQIMEHVMVSELGTISYMKKKSLAKSSDIPSADAENQKNAKELMTALKSSKKWKAPLVLPIPKGDKKRIEFIGHWQKQHEEMKRFMLNLSEEYYDKQIYKHPLAGRMNLSSAIDFLKNHMIHHTHQLNRIEKAYESL